MDAIEVPRSEGDVRVEAIRMAAALVTAAGVLVLVVSGLTWWWPLAGYHSLPLAAMGVLTIAGSFLMRAFPLGTWRIVEILLVFFVLLATMGQVLFTGARSFGPVVLLWGILWAFAFLPRTRALIHTGVALTGMTAIFVFQPGWKSPAVFAIFLGGTILVTAWLVSRLVARAEMHAERERLARIELARMNETLEARVSEQVDELSRLDRLRRFLSPSIAEAVVSTDGPSRLAPHRAQIAAVFCDLRGFTAFSSEAEPEDVTSLLGRFHDVIGPLVDRYEATVGGFAGDGVALYFNDPIPCLDPAVRAVRLALDLENPMGQLTREWRQLGFEVGYGVGIALGYATLGVIGIEHRREYTAIGTVMNLASRLSDEAGPSEILLDQRAASAVQEQIATESTGELNLKGFPRPVPAYRVVSNVS